MQNYTDSFDDGTIGSEWTVQDGTWSEANGDLTADSTPAYITTDRATAYGTYTVEFGSVPSGGDVGEGYIWFVDTGTGQDGYRIKFNQDSLFSTVLQRVNNGNTSNIDSSSANLQTGDTVTIERKLTDEITVDINGSEVLTTTDTNYTTSARFGLATQQTAGSFEFDSVTVARQPPTLDVVTAGSGDGEIDITATTGDGNLRVYYAETSGVSEGQASIDGVSSSDTLSLEAGERYWIAAQAVDEYLESGLSNELAATATLSAPTITGTTDSAQGEITVDYATQDNAADGGVDVLDNGSLVETRDLPSRALSFDGVDDYVDIGALPFEQATANGEITISLNIKYDELNDFKVALGGKFGDTLWIEPHRSDSVGVSWLLSDANGTQYTHETDVFLDADTDYRVTYTYDGAEMKAFVGAVEAGSQSENFTPSAPSNGEIGSYNGSPNAVNADITDVRIYNRALSGAEVSTLASGGHVQNGLVAWYPILGDGPVAWDASGNQHHGDIQGATRVDGPPELGDPPTATLTGLSEASQHDITVRRTTDHTSTDSGTDTQFVKPSAPSTLDIQRLIDYDRVRASWTDTSSGEDDQILRADSTDSGTVVDTAVGANTEQADTDSLPTGETYDLSVIASVGSGAARATSESGTDSVKIPDRRRDRVAASGWSLKVETEDGVRWPAVVGEVQEARRINDQPEVDIPVVKDSTWDQQQWEGASVAVWEDGLRVPVEEIRDVTQSQSQTILRCVGGVELERPVSEQFQETENHIAARQLIDDYTGYDRSVDDPDSTTSADVPVQSADSDTEITDALAGSLIDDSTHPLTVDAGRLETHRAAHVIEAEDSDNQPGNSRQIVDSTSLSNGRALRIEGQTGAQDGVWSFTPDYDIPSPTVALFINSDGTTSHPFTLTLDGTQVENTSEGGIAGVGGSTPAWFQTLSDGPNLTAGSTSELRLDVSSDAGDEGDFTIDALAVFDGRFDLGQSSGAWEDLVSIGGTPYVKGPYEHPSSLTVETADANTVRQITGGSLTSTWNATTRNQRIRLSNDQGATWNIEGENTESIDGAFASGSAQIRAEFRLSVDAGQARAPAFNRGQSLDGWTINADLNDTPLLINALYDGTVKEALQTIAERGDMLWEVTWNDGITIEWTQSGQRGSDSSFAVSRAEATKETDYYTKAIVKGTSQQRTNVQRTADYSTPDAVLPDDYLQTGRESVYDPDGDTTYVRGDDYELDELSGTLTILSTGNIADGQTVAIDYEYRTRGVYEAPDHSGNPQRVLKETIPGVTTDRAAEQAALVLVQQLGSPRWTASAALNDVPRDQLLIEEVGIRGLDTDTFEIYDVRNTPTGSEVSLGSGPSVQEVVSRIQQTLTATSDQI